APVGEARLCAARGLDRLRAGDLVSGRPDQRGDLQLRADGRREHRRHRDQPPGRGYGHGRNHLSLRSPTMNLRAWGLAAGLAPASGPVPAHDLWLTFGADGRAIVNYGHPDDRLPPDPERLVELRWRDGPSALSLLKSLTRAERDGIAVAVTEPTVS